VRSFTAATWIARTQKNNFEKSSYSFVRFSKAYYANLKYKLRVINGAINYLLDDDTRLKILYPKKCVVLRN
jgi:hypothetical protein